LSRIAEQLVALGQQFLVRADDNKCSVIWVDRMNTLTRRKVSGLISTDICMLGHLQAGYLQISQAVVKKEIVKGSGGLKSVIVFGKGYTYW
jgi:hypothetical protein